MQGWTIPPQGSQPELPAATSFTNPPTITPAELRKIFIKRKWVILTAVLVGLAVAFYHIETTVPLYEATARIDIDFGRQTNIGFENLIQQNTEYGEPDEELQTQAQIMRSETVAMNAINMLNLVNKSPFSEIFEKDRYNGHLTPNQRNAMLGIFQGSTKIAVVPNTGLVDVSFQSPDPQVAMDAANAIVQAYKDRDLQSRYQGMSQISTWLAGQLSGLKQQVGTNQKVLSDYVQRHNLLPSDSNGGSLITDNLSTVNQQLAEAKADRIVKEARYKMAQTRNPDLLTSVAPGTILSSLRQQQGELMGQEAQLRSKFGPEYPKVHQLDKELASIQSDIDSETNNLTARFAEEYNTAVQTENLMQSRLDDLQKAAYRENQSAAQFEILKHEAESSAALYDALELKLQEAGITSGLSSNAVDVIDSARLPQTPVVPRKRSDLTYGLLGGVVGGVVLAFFLETLDDTLRTSEDAEAISHLPTLAVVPHLAMKKPAEPPKAGSGLLPDLVSYLDPQSIGAEAFRTLRSAILLSAVDRDPKVLLITSGLAEEGKSTIAANLAISFAQRDEKVLLVDTDLRRGTTHLKLGLPNHTGLSTVLARESSAEAYARPIPDLPNLTLLSRGPIAPNPGEMLSSHAMEELLRQWRASYDRIILDSSPVLAVADSLALVPLVDNVMILIRAGVTRKKALLRTRELLRRSAAHISGSVVNDVNLRLEHYYTYARRYSYGYKSNYGSGYGAGYGKGQNGEK